MDRTTPLRHPQGWSRWALVAAGVLVLLAIVLGIQWWNKHPTGNDFATYFAASRELWNGGNPYLVPTPHPFVYPLFLCVALWPLAQLPLVPAGVVWLLLSIVAMVVTIGALGRIRSDGDTSKLLVASAIAFIPLTDIVQNNLVNGQVNFIVIACCAAFAWSRHRGRHTIGSFWLGAAIAIKLTPAILLGFLARRLEWRRVVETVVIAAILGVVLPWLITGADVFDYYRDYFGTFVTDTISDARVDSAERFPFSVAGVVRKFVGVSSPISATIIGLAMAAVLVLWLDRGGAARSGRSLALTVCLYLAGALLITPMSEIHHLASLLPGLTLLAYQALEPRKPLWLRWGLAVALLSAIVIRRVPGAAFVSVAATCALLAAALRREALD